MKWQFLMGDVNWGDYGGKFIGPKINHGDFDFWPVIDVINMKDACGDEATETYHVELSIVAPSEVNEDELAAAIRSCGRDDVDLDNPLVAVELHHSYGHRAVLWQESGDDLRQLMHDAKKEAKWRAEGILFGIVMDGPQNAIGTTGWDMVKGDLLAPIGQ
jgi:hypothetical protein